MFGFIRPNADCFLQRNHIQVKWTVFIIHGKEENFFYDYYYFFYKCNPSKPNVAVKKGQRICTSKCQFFTISYDSIPWVIQSENIKDKVRWNRSQSLCPLFFPLKSGKMWMEEKCILKAFPEKHLGLLVDYKLSITQQCTLTAKKARGTLSCTRRSVASRQRVVTLSL